MFLFSNLTSLTNLKKLLHVVNPFVPCRPGTIEEIKSCLVNTSTFLHFAPACQVTDISSQLILLYTS